MFLDGLARRSLWDAGMDFHHATGHGIGAYLNVHEYPPTIQSHATGHGLQKNMFTTNGNIFLTCIFFTLTFVCSHVI